MGNNKMIWYLDLQSVRELIVESSSYLGSQLTLKLMVKVYMRAK